MSNINKIVFSLLALLIIGAAYAGKWNYSHNCQQELREVDRYAQPYIIEFMQALGTWNMEKITPYLTQSYVDSYSTEDWQEDMDELKRLGELNSFARPNHVSHKAFKEYYILESANDLYSVASEFEHANAVVRIFFNNQCGKLKVNKFIVSSNFLNIEPEFLKDYRKRKEQKKNSGNPEVKKESSKPKAKSETKKPQGAIYRY